MLFIFVTASLAQSIPTHYYQDLNYRLIGPFRASRSVGGVGIPDQPNVFFMGVNNGGVWKTDDYGRTWNPIFDDAPTGSVGDIAVYQGNPQIIYVGTGEGLHRPDLGVGDGIFKSIDGGGSWRHIGLNDVQQVARIIVHPTNPDIVFVAGLGHPYGPNEQRGIFRSVDGGINWENTLYINQNTGAIQVEFDPNDPEILFAYMWEHREGPWENASFSGTKSGLFKSTDGGSTWRQVTKGLPGSNEGLGRIGIGIARSNSKRMYATVNARKNGGIYRSDDGGESWKLVSNEGRLWERGNDFGEIQVHPENQDVVFVGNVASYRSDDGGRSWTSLKGAPGGDDYHRIWINPKHPEIMLFVADQGATITVNSGRTWSSWYNQPTAQLYHVSTDNQFPYWVYGGQQESGAIGIASRGNGGQISFRDWIGIGADEYGYVAPDPLHPEIIYGSRVIRFNKKTGQSQNVAPEALRSGKYRILRSMPLLFHPSDPTMLLFATNVLWKTNDGGQKWEIISPDLSREQPEVPESIGDFRTAELTTMARRGVIYAVGASPVDVNTIWAGTDDGLVHVTKDGGKSWIDVTPPALKSWDKVSSIDASHFHAGSAYIAVNAIRKDDMQPHIFSTHNYGATWKHSTNGLYNFGPVNVVREDPVLPGLLFAGTEREVYFSIDDGNNWQSLKMNMPALSIRDLVIHENDLVVGSHGRSIWIMDNIAPIREIAETMQSSGAYLFSPTEAIRVRWNMFSDTPLPPEEPAGQNPPDGAILDYYLSVNADKVDLEIYDNAGKIVRDYASDDAPENIDTTSLPHPTYWIQPAKRLEVGQGHHRFVWDLRYEQPKGTRRQYAISAVYQRTPSGPQGPLVPPGIYIVKLIVDGASFEKSIIVKMDPRVKISEEDLNLQTKLSMDCYNGYMEAQEIREQVEESLKNAKKDREKVLMDLLGNRIPGNPDVLYGSIYFTAKEDETIMGLQFKFLYILNLVQGADVRPTTQAETAVIELQTSLEYIKTRWEELE